MVKDKKKPYYCPIHKTTTKTDCCVACQALRVKPRAHPLPSGTVELELTEDHAAREAEIARYRPTGGDE